MTLPVKPRTSGGTFVSDGSRDVRRIYFVALALFLGNLGAMIDVVYHPEIPYFDPEHLITGGITIVASLASLASLEVYLSWRARAEADAQSRIEEQLRAILESAMDGFWVVDLQGRVLMVNDTYCRMSGFSAQELLRMKVTDLEAVEAPEETAERFRTIIANGDGRFEAHHRRKDGTVMPLEISVQYRPAEGGRMVAFLRDITERTRAGAERAALEARLLQAQKLESVGRLAGGVAHDFNNMLGVILGYAEFALARVTSSDPLRADLLEIQKAAGRSADLTRQLLAFARKQAIAPKVLDLNATVPVMLSMLQRLLGEDIRLVWQPAKDLWMVTMDATQMDQILTNLSVNARDAIAGVGTLTIGTSNRAIDAAFCSTHADAVPGEYVRLVVRDTGGGMDDATVAQIFEPFFTTKGVGLGTGLGLSSVYGAVRQNHGFITVASRLGAGTEFALYLPRTRGEATDDGADRPDRADRGDLAPPDRWHETILLVEDERAMLRLTARALEQTGYAVLAAGAPGEAIDLAREHHGDIHLLLTDVIMPGMNGPELANRLVALRPRLRPLFMSGHPANVVTGQGGLADGAPFIAKPFTFAALAIAVRDVLDRE